MINNATHHKHTRAVTLVEVVVAMVILTIVAVGALGYQYHAVRHTQIAKVETTAVRTAQLLLEDWKSAGGPSDYDPTLLGLGFTSTSLAPYDFASGHATMSMPYGNVLNNQVYAITVNNISVLVMLNWTDIDYDSTAEVTLRELSVTVRQGQQQDIEQYETGSADSSLRLSGSYNLKPVILITYVRLDAAGG